MSGGLSITTKLKFTKRSLKPRLKRNSRIKLTWGSNFRTNKNTIPGWMELIRITISSTLTSWKRQSKRLMRSSSKIKTRKMRRNLTWGCFCKIRCLASSKRNEKLHSSRLRNRIKIWRYRPITGRRKTRRKRRRPKHSKKRLMIRRSRMRKKGRRGQSDRGSRRLRIRGCWLSKRPWKRRQIRQGLKLGWKICRRRIERGSWPRLIRRVEERRSLKSLLKRIRLCDWISNKT